MCVNLYIVDLGERAGNTTEKGCTSQITWRPICRHFLKTDTVSYKQEQARFCQHCKKIDQSKWLQHIERFHSRGQITCKFIEKKEKNSTPTELVSYTIMPTDALFLNTNLAAVTWIENVLLLLIVLMLLIVLAIVRPLVEKCWARAFTCLFWLLFFSWPSHSPGSLSYHITDSSFKHSS